MLKERVITAIVAVAALLLVLFVLPSPAVEVIIALVILAGAWEWSGFLASPSTTVRVVYVVFIAVLLALVTALAPQISPGKTWEGVIGGLLTVGVLALAGGYLFGAHVAVLVPFCLAVACASIVGDLTVSMFKRTAGLKDSGTIFPGHGGILDRVDSVAAAAPLFALGVGWTGLQ